MKLQLLGPLDRVTGSMSLLTDDRLGVRILVDAGVRQGEVDAERWNQGPLPCDAASLTHVLLTHAHLDHCGLLPRLYAEGYRGRVVCTAETAALTRVQLEDAARVARADPTSIQAVDFDGRSERFGSYIPLARDVFVQMFPTSHILGAVSMRVSWGAPKTPAQRSIVFSGDLGRNVDRRESFLFGRHRQHPPPSTFAVIETTYGDRVRELAGESFLGRVGALREHIVRARSCGGSVVVAAFALDRFQMILLDLAYLASIDSTLASIPILAHGPLAKKFSSIYARFVDAKDPTSAGELRPRWLSKSAFRLLGLDERSAQDERTLEQAMRVILDPASTGASPLRGLVRAHRWVDAREVPSEPHVVVTCGGMLEGGPILHYLADVLPDQRATLLLSGHAGPRTLGGKLVTLGRLLPSDRTRVPDAIDLPGVCLPVAEVRARIDLLPGYSAHADQAGLLAWLMYEYDGRPQRVAQTVFLQHGTQTSRRALTAKIAHCAPDMAVILPSEGAYEFDLEGPVGPSREALEARIALLEAELRAARAAAA